jgi:hypothetical protein
MARGITYWNKHSRTMKELVARAKQRERDTPDPEVREDLFTPEEFMARLRSR